MTFTESFFLAMLVLAGALLVGAGGHQCLQERRTLAALLSTGRRRRA